MISPEEIRTVPFERTMRGYRCDDVDEFLEKVADDVKEMTERIAALQKQKEESDQKLHILAQKIEEYRADEDTLKIALLNAQRMGENVIREAKQKAESILREANIKAEDITRDSREQVVEYNVELERIQAEVAHFKSSVLNLYKQHIESLSTLPGEEEPAEPAEEIQQEAVEAAPEFIPAEAPVQDIPAQQEPAAPEAFAAPAEPEVQPEGGEDLWGADFPREVPEDATVVFDPEPAPEEPAADEPLPSILDGFQGIKFSD